MKMNTSQREVLRQIDIAISNNGGPPSDTHLGRKCGFSSSNACLVRNGLKKLGLVDFTARYPRTLRVTKKGRAVLAELRGQHEAPDVEIPEAAMPKIRSVYDPREPVVTDESLLKDKAMCLLIDAYSHGAHPFAAALGGILHLIPGAKA